MKVTRNKEFTPITITLETEEEALAMWLRLNASTRDIDSSNKDTTNLECPVGISLSMWRVINDVFDPTATEEK